MIYVIKHVTNNDYWSNDDGWTEFRSSATEFTKDDVREYKHLPHGGEWCKECQ